MNTDIDLSDVQGNILRGYRFPDVRHYALSVTDVAGGKQLLTALVDGHGDLYPLATAEEWSDDKPDACVNLAITAPGLTALGVPDDMLKQFPASFRAGAAQQAVDSAASSDFGRNGVGLGDIGESAPVNWVVGGPSNPEIHLLVSIWSDETSAPARDRIEAALLAVCAANGVKERSRHTGHTFANNHVHFGFRDGVSQPQVAGRPGNRIADMQPDVPTGDFLLGKGYRNSYGGNFIEGIPGELAGNGTYAVFRILEQDVQAFDALIERTGRRFGIDPELVAAKLVGRWRSGESLAMRPNEPRLFAPARLPDGQPNLAPDKVDMSKPFSPVDDAELNEFDYAPTYDHPMQYDDADGLRCPLGAHMRRLNPRGGTAAGIQHNHRIIRRGVPYGPEHRPGDPDDREERGLLGIFICGDIANQFEFLQMMWANDDVGTPGVLGTRDPIIGWQPPEGGTFRLPTGDNRGDVVISDLPRLVTTRGALYCFMPGIAGVKWLAGR